MPEKKPFITLEQAQEIIADVPTPFHLYDEKGIRANARLVNKAFAWNKGFKEYFAVKATPNPYLLRILKEEGCGVDCSSYTELLLSEACGFSGSDIMFSSNQTPVEDMKKAYEMGAYINLDDATMVDFLDRVAGIPENIFCRYNPGGTFQLGESEEGFQVMDKPGDAKYGMTRAQLSEGLKQLKALGAKRFGLHAFLASNMLGESYYPTLAGLLFELGRDLQEETGMPLAFLNLSGGVGIPYRPEDEPADLMEIGRRVEKEYRRVLGDPAAAGVAIKTELGRAMTGPYGWLVTRAMHRKDTYKQFIGVDACSANLLRPAMYGAYHHVSIVGRADAPNTHTYDITGALCENNDKFAVDRPMPEIRMGDLLLIHDAGAHAFAMGYQYNGRLRSAEVLYRGNADYQLIRRAETTDDYFATLYGEGLPRF